MTIMLTPFMSCSAKMPIYAFFTAAFFPKSGGLVMIVLYFGGILMGILTAMASKNTLFRGEAVPFVMELPNYRMPGLKNTLRLMWDKARDFLERAFTVIFIGTIVVWFLQTFDFRLNMVADTGESMLALIAGAIAPIFTPAGLGDWKLCTALISGFLAKAWCRRSRCSMAAFRSLPPRLRRSPRARCSLSASSTRPASRQSPLSSESWAACGL